MRRFARSTFKYSLPAAAMVACTMLSGCETDDNMRDVDDRDNRMNWDSGSAPDTRNTVGGSPQGTGTGIDRSRSTGGTVADYPPGTNNTVGGTPQGTGAGTGNTRGNVNGSNTPHYAPDQNNTVGGTPQGTGAGTTGSNSTPNRASNDLPRASDTTSDSSANRPAAAAISADDQRFANEALIVGMFEVRSSRIALQQNPDADVKQFADMMIKDHTAANDELKALARRKGITLPADLDGKHAGMIQELQKMDDQTAFGSSYLDMQIKAHEEAVKLFADAAENADDADIRAFAAKTLPTLRKHLEHVRNMK